MERALIQTKQIQELIQSPHHSSPDLPLLISNFHFFSNLNTQHPNSNIIESLSKHLKLQSYDPDTTIYSINSDANSFFFILQGKVTLQKSTKIANPQNPSRPFSPKKLFTQLLRSPQTKRLTIQDLFTLTNEIVFLTIFESFGDEILSECFFRKNTVIAKEKTVLMYLNYDDYKKELKSIKKLQKAEIRAFLQGLQLFNGWTKRNLEKVQNYFYLQDCSKNQTLYRQGDEPDNVYLIKKGEFILTQNVDLADEHKVQIHENGSRNIFRFANMKQKPTEKNVQVLIKGQNEALGIEEVLKNQDSRQFTCVCRTDRAQVVTTSKEIFANKILNTDTMASLKNALESTEEWMDSRIAAVKMIEKAKASLKLPQSAERKQEKSSHKHRSIHFIRKIEEDDRKDSISRTQRRVSVSTFLCAKERKPERTFQVSHKYKSKKNPPPNFLITLREKPPQRKPVADFTSKTFYTMSC